MKKIFKEMNVIEKIQFICVFLPILSTVGWIVNEVAGTEITPLVSFIAEMLLIVGLIAALICIVITDALGFLKFVFSFIVKGWTIGMLVCPVFPICFATALVGFCITLMLAFLACVLVPVVITIYFYFFREK